MRLVFLDDENACAAAQETLSAAFVQWLDERSDEAGPPDAGRRRVARAVAEAALEYKADTDGLLGRWTAEDLHDVLDDWMPRKTILDVAARPAALPGLHAWVTFLDRHRLLDARSDPTDVLHAVIDSTADRYLAGMADPARYDTAKFWVTAMRAHGVDLDDERARDRFRYDVRDGRVDVDASIPERATHRQADRVATRRKPPLPPVVLAPDPELAVAAAHSPALTLFRRLLDWLGDGRPLDSGEVTGSGDLATALDLPPGSPVDAPDAGEILAWAQAARVVRPFRGCVVPVKRTARLLDSRPLDLWDRALDALIERAEPVAAGRDPAGLRDRAPGAAAAILTALYREGAAVPRMLLRDLTDDESEDPGSADGAIDRNRQLTILRSLRAVEYGTESDPEMLDLLTELSDGAPVDTGTVALTSLGTRAANRILRAEGYPAPLATDLAEETAEVLIASIADAADPARRAAFAAWRAARDDRAATDELAELAERTSDPDHRRMATAALDELDPNRVATP